MITISRRQALLFRTVLKNSLLDQEPQREWPLVLFQASSRGLLLSAQKGDLAIQFHLPGNQGEETIAFRSTILTEVEARSDEPVTLEQVAPDKGRASWHEGAVPRVWDFETVTPDSVPAFPTVPRKLIPFPDAFRVALADAALLTAKQNTRYSLAKIQVSGKEGKVAATDGRQLLVNGGLEFPWQDEFLIPRLPALTRKGLLPEEPLAIGKTNKDLALRLGPWLFLFRIDSQDRFPNIHGVIPDPRGVTCKLVLSAKDADLLARALPKLPCSDQDNWPVTLDMAERIFIRARGFDDERITEIELPGSQIEGNPTRLNLNRQYLHRALELGFRQLEVIKPDQPLMCRAGERLYLFLPLDPKSALAPAANGAVVAPPNNHCPEPPVTIPERREIMPPPNSRIPPEPEKPNGHQPGLPLSLESILTEAEELRVLFQEAGGRLSRLVGDLKQFRRQNKVFEQAVASLRQLKLDR